MTVFIVGGAKSGKSDFAQQVALKLAMGEKHYYVATMIPSDSESDRAIIRSHLDRRAGMGFETIECGKDILSCLDVADPEGTFMVDAVTTLLTNAIFPAEKNYATDEAGAETCCEELLKFIKSVKHAVIVSDDLFRDAVRYDADTDAYRRHLGAIHCRLAESCDVVMEMAFGNLIIHKGDWK